MTDKELTLIVKVYNLLSYVICEPNPKRILPVKETDTLEEFMKKLKDVREEEKKHK